MVYSWLLANWVFVVTNALILVTALAGEGVYLANRRAQERRRRPEGARADDAG